MEYTLVKLRALPTLRSGPVADLKIETDRYRVWVRRVDDGRAPISFHARCGNRWELIGQYRDRLPPICRRLIDGVRPCAVG